MKEDNYVQGDHFMESHKRGGGEGGAAVVTD